MNKKISKYILFSLLLGVFCMWLESHAQDLTALQESECNEWLSCDGCGANTISSVACEKKFKELNWTNLPTDTNLCSDTDIECQKLLWEWITDPIDPDDLCDPSKECCGVELNTDVPFIGKCIEMGTSNSAASADGKTTNVNSLNAFPVLMWWLSKIMITVILILSFIAIIAGGVMMAGDGLMGSYSNGKKLIMKVLAWLVLLGASWIILKLINPNFFW